MFKVYKWTLSQREFASATQGRPSKLKFLVCEIFGYDGQERKWVYKVDERAAAVTVLMVSRVEPSVVPPYGLWSEVSVPADFMTRGAYRVRARILSEVVGKAEPGAKRGKSFFVFDRDASLAAVRAMLSRNGMEVVEVEDARMGRSQDPKSGMGAVPYMDLVSIVRVTDQDKFATAVEKGVGGLKSYGFGAIIPSPVSC